MTRTALMVLTMATATACLAQADRAASVDATTLRGKVMCGYQGWFRCPGDAAGLGWVHWSRDRNRIAPETLTFEMWPDMTEYADEEQFPAPGFTYPDGSQATLFSSDSARTVRRHFGWMREYGIDGAWLQRFLVGLPGGPAEIQTTAPRRQRTSRLLSAEYLAKSGRRPRLKIGGLPTSLLSEGTQRFWRCRMPQPLCGQ